MDYGKNPEKTGGGRLVSCYECDPTETNDQFLMKKQIYEQITHQKEKNVDTNVLIYQIRQSFSPEENITPEQANKIGMELARKFAGDDFQIVVCTHIDKKHIHNHIYFNSTSLDCSRKFENVKDSAFIVRKLSDELCEQNELSIVTDPAEKGLDYKDWLDKQSGIDWKAIFKAEIDELIPQCKSVKEFKQKLKDKGYSLRGKKTLSISHPDRKRGMKTDYVDKKLDYSLDGIEYAIKHNGRMLPNKKKISLEADKKIKKLQDLENKTGGLKFWAEKQNLQEFAKAYSYTKEHGINYGELAATIESVEDKFNFTSDKIKQLDSDLKKSGALKVHIINYAKTVKTYKAYTSSRHKEKFYEENKGDILLHEASRQAFKSLGLKTIPKMPDLKANIESLKMEKAEHYSTYKELRTELNELRTVKQIVEKYKTYQSVKENVRDRENDTIKNKEVKR